MNLNLIQPKNEVEDVLLSITKNCETLIEQNHRKAEEALEFKMIKPRETFILNPPIQVKKDWLLGLVDLEVYNSIVNITEENNKIELYKFPDEESDGLSYEKVRDEIERHLDISDIRATDLHDEIIGPIIVKEYREQVTKRMEDGGYMNNLAGNITSIFQDFERYLRTEVDLVADDIKLVSDNYNLNFNTYDLQRDFYTFKDLSQTLLRVLQPEYEGYHNVIIIEIDDITMKTKLVVRSDIIAIRFKDKSFFNTILGFTSDWDYKSIMKTLVRKL